LNKFANAGKNVGVSHALPRDLSGAPRKEPVLVIEAIIRGWKINPAMAKHSNASVKKYMPY
jgi:hypothetical protein